MLPSEVSRLRRARSLLAAIALDWPRYALRLRSPGAGYMRVCNRHETLEGAPHGEPGWRCGWQWTSDLNAPRILPFLGKRLLERALATHGFDRRSSPTQSKDAPDITFIIGHRGMARLPHLLATLETIAAQQDVRIECIVVEQDVTATAAEHLPSWVRHVHTPTGAQLPYCRSWAFNVGARHARSPVLVLHDNDMLVPAQYSAQLLERVRAGYEVINLKRFVFYLDAAATALAMPPGTPLPAVPPEAITQNLQGGGSVAITSLAFDRIGGMDESFVGWGGEDNEFWDRCLTLRVWDWAYLPLIHLWHPPQPLKQERSNPTLARYEALTAMAATTRIEQLRGRDRGRMDGPLGEPR